MAQTRDTASYGDGTWIGRSRPRRQCRGPASFQAQAVHPDGILQAHPGGHTLGGPAAGGAGRFLRQLLGGLQHVHSQGTHRDLKPKNIFVDYDNLKLGDFGLASGDITEHRAGGGCRRRHVSAAAAASTTAAEAEAAEGADGQNAANRAAGEGAERSGVPEQKSTAEHTADVGTYLYMDPTGAGATRRSLTPTHSG